MPGLNTGTFALADLPRAPQFPTNLGQLQAIDPDKVYADVGKGLAQANAIATDQQQQAANLAQLGEQQGTANANRQTLAGMVAAKQAQNALATQQAGASSSLIPAQTKLATTNLSQGQTMAQIQANLADQASKELPQFPQKLASIGAMTDANGNPDYAAQAKAYQQLQASSPYLTLPSLAGENAEVGQEREAAYNILAAKAKQANDLARTQLIVGGRNEVAQTNAGARTDAANINQGKPSGPIDAAYQRLTRAQNNLSALPSDADPAEVAAAQQNLATAQQQVEAVKAAAPRSSAAASPQGQVSQSAFNTFDDLSSNLLNNIGQLRAQIAQGTTGIMGTSGKLERAANALTGVQNRGTDFQTTLDSTTGQQVLNTIQQLRAASKNGSSGFVRITNQELPLLQNAITTLKNSQSDEQFQNNLDYLEQQITRTHQRLATQAQADAQGGNTQPAAQNAANGQQTASAGASTAPPQGKLQTLTPEQAKTQPSGTQFIGTDGRQYTIP